MFLNIFQLKSKKKITMETDPKEKEVTTEGASFKRSEADCKNDNRWLHFT